MITTLALLAHYTGPRAVWLIVVRSLLTKADNSFDSLMQAGFELLLQYAECPGAFDNRDLLWARLDLETFARPYVFGKIAVTELEPAEANLASARASTTMAASRSIRPSRCSTKVWRVCRAPPPRCSSICARRGRGTFVSSAAHRPT